MERAVRVARAADVAGADLVEVGDPLIKRHGVGAVSAIRQAAPSVRVVAEMISTDWGRDQVEQAAFNGADVVLLIGPASQASVGRATARALALGMILMLDIPVREATEESCRAAQDSGVDGFVVTTNIDLGMHGPYPIQVASRLRRWTELPIAASGGFSETELRALSHADCDILIVGRSVVEALDPEAAAHRICHAMRSAGDDT
jgi:3-keto-L-gulonate-6-phosphate decarboxylase